MTQSVPLHTEIRTFTAKRFDEAIARVRGELGPDALVLAAREVRGLLGGGHVELDAALPMESHGRDAAPGTRQPIGINPLLANLLAGGVDPQPHRPQSSRPQPMSAAELEEELARVAVPRALAAAIAARAIRAPFASTVDRVGAALDELLRFAGSEDTSNARAIALVGPTGVGKTTTLAKLAAHAALVEGRRVGLVTLDEYRVAGAEQLERYADLIGVPMLAARDASTFARALSRFDDHDVVFIDTPGRSPRDAHAFEALAACLHGTKHRVDVHLCVSAATDAASIATIVARHRVLAPSYLAMTKLDEAAHVGSVVDAQSRCSLPLSYFTTGQRVPEDIEDATGNALATHLLQNGNER